MPPNAFWSPPTTQATRPRPRLLAENGRTGLERGPQPHIIASPPGTGAPIDRINYTPDTGEIHPPGVLAPTDKLNYSLVPHDDLNYNGQLGQTSSPPAPGSNPPGMQAQGGGDAGSMMSSGMQPQGGQGPLQSNVWANTGDPGLRGMGGGADIMNSPGTPAGTDGLMGRYGEGAALRNNTFSPGQPPLSPTPYGTGPGPRAQASGPNQQAFDMRASSTGNLGTWGQSMGMGADDDQDGFDDDTGEPIDDSPEAGIYGRGPNSGGSQGGTSPSGSSSTVTPQDNSIGGDPAQAPTTPGVGYHFRLDPPNLPDGQPPRGGDGRPLRQSLYQTPDDPNSGRPEIPIGFYDAQFKAGSSERPFTRYTLQQQRSMSPDYAKELDAAAKGQSATGNHTVQVIGSDGNKHSVLVDKEGKTIADQGIVEMAKPVLNQGDRKTLGGTTAHPMAMVKGADGNWTEDKAESARLAKDYADKQEAAANKADLDRQARLDAAQSKPFGVYNDSAGQTWKVNTQTGESEKLGPVDPKAGTWELNGRLVHYDPDKGTFDEVYKPPPGYDIHYDTYGRAIAVNKDDPTKSTVVYSPEDYEDRKALDRQKTLADIEKAKSGLLTDKAAQVKSRVDLLNTLNELENPKPIMTDRDILVRGGGNVDVQRYNPETKTSTYEHVSGGPMSQQQTTAISRIHSMLDELDKAFASGDANKAAQIQDQIKQTQGTQQTQQPKQEDQPGIIDVGQQVRDARGGQDIRPGWPGYDPEHLGGAAQPPTTRTTAAGDIASYDPQGNLTGIRYINTAPPHYGEEGYPGSEGYEGVGGTLQGGLEQEQPAEEETPWGQEEEQQPEDDYWAQRRQGYMGTGTDIPQGGQGLPEKHRPAGNPGYSTEPSPLPSPAASPPPGAPMAPGMAPPGGAPGPGGPPQDPTALVSQPGYNPLKPPDLAALGPPGGGGASTGGAPVGMPPSQSMGGMQGAPPNLDDPLFKFAMQRRQGGGAPMGGGQDEPAQPGGSSYAGWTPPVPQDDVAGIGHRFGQQMNVGEPFHSGVDLQAVEGTPTISPVDGVVQRVEYNPQGLGITVILQGKDGTTHKLGHLKETSAYPGLVVSQGQDLQSKVGSTGNTTGSHLHWAVKTPDGQPTDPTASLGPMAALPPVPGTQMMGPPGGSVAPGGPGGRGAPPGVAAPSGALTVPQGAPPTPQAQPAPGGQAQPVPPGGGQDVGAGADEGYDPDWAKKARAEREAARIKRREEAQGKWAPTGKSSEVPQTDEPQDPDETWWQEEEDRPRTYQPGQGMAGRGSSKGRSPGSEVGGRYQRSQEDAGQTAAQQRGWNPQPNDYKDSPYRLEARNPHDQETNPGEWRKWNNQHNWFLRQQGGTTGGQVQEVDRNGQPVTRNPMSRPRARDLNQQLNNLVNQGWPQEAVDELKDLGRPPTQQDINWIRNRYKNMPATSPDKPDTPAEVQAQGPTDATDWEADYERRKAAGFPTTRPADVSMEDWQKQVAEHSDIANRRPGIEDPNSPDYGNEDLITPKDMSDYGMSLDEAKQILAEQEGRTYQSLSRDEVERGNLAARVVVQSEKEKPGWEPPPPEEEPNGGLNPGEPKVDPEEEQYQEALRHIQSKYPGADDDTETVYGSPAEAYKGLFGEDAGPGAKWTPGEIDQWYGGKGTSKSVSPPIDLGGGHKPPVGPKPEDLIGKPNIFVPPTIPTGGHIPVPLPDFPKGHVPGPEIKLPNVTDIPHPDIHLPEIGRPDIQLPDWLPGQGKPQPPTDVGTPTGTPEDYSDMLERLRQLGQGAGQEDGQGDPEDVQIAQVVGCSPDEVTDEMRQWWASRPQAGAAQPGEDGMGAGLSLTMRQPIRMPSSRMEMRRSPGWTPRAGGIGRRPSMGTSAMVRL